MHRFLQDEIIALRQLRFVRKREHQLRVDSHLGSKRHQSGSVGDEHAPHELYRRSMVPE